MIAQKFVTWLQAQARPPARPPPAGVAGKAEAKYDGPRGSRREDGLGVEGRAGGPFMLRRLRPAVSNQVSREKVYTKLENLLRVNSLLKLRSKIK